MFQRASSDNSSNSKVIEYMNFSWCKTIFRDEMRKICKVFVAA
jgi:hypothetical protein